jgi:O-antigen ligase
MRRQITFPGMTPRHPEVALAALLFFGVLTLWVRERWALSLLQAGTFLAGMVWIAAWGLGRATLRGSFLLIPFAAAAAWGLLQLALGTTVYHFDTWNAVLFWTTALVLVFVSLQALGRQAGRQSFLRLLVYFGFGLSVLATTQYFTSGGKVFWVFPSGYPDALGPFVYRNNYAAFIELLLPLALLEAIRDRHRAVAYAAMAGVMYASVIASASRAGSILASCEIVAVLALALARGLVSTRQLGRALLGIVGMAFLFTAIVGPGTLIERLKLPDPFVHRREMFYSALAMGRERPGLGFGLGTFEKAYPAYASFDVGLVVNHAHNDWAEWLAEGGVPFALLLMSAGVWAVRPAIRSLWGLGVISVLLHALVDYPMQRLGLAAWVFVMLAALAAEEGERRRLTRSAAPATDPCDKSESITALGSE